VSVRLEAFVHLAGNAAYPLLMVLTVCLVPAMVAVSRTLPLSLQLFEYLLLALGLLPVTLFLVAGQRGQGRGAWRTLRDVAAALLVGAGLAPSNTRAWFEGLGPGVGEWVRTPKTGEGGLRGRGPLYRPRVRGRGLAELTLAAGLGVLAAWAWHAGMIRPLPHLLLMFSGFAYVGARSLGIGAAPLSES
jgi:hypothetical protein